MAAVKPPAPPFWRRWLSVFGCALLLAASAPPAWFPGAEWLVLPGWMAFYALFARTSRPLRQAYGLGVLHVLAFSFCLRHVLWLGWLAIGLVGGLYYVLLAVGLRKLRPLSGPLAFGVALAAAHWLRANMPEIHYPHGQPCHSLYQHVWALGPVAWGGEALANLLLGAIAAALVELWGAWRLALWPWRGAVLRAVVAPLLWLLCCLAPPPSAPPAAADLPTSVDVAAVEPGLHPMDAYDGIAPGDLEGYRRRFRQLFDERLLRPTQQLAGAGATAPPELVLWPESSLPGADVDPAATASFDDFLRRLGLHLQPGVRLCLGAGALHRDVHGQLVVMGERREPLTTPAAVLVDAEGRYLAHQEKLRPVPGGEVLPFVGWLPDSWRQALLDYVQAAMGAAPMSLQGRALPPMHTAAGVPFGALLCFDNAFAELAAAQVRQGARLLVVLSNEAWYRGGGELQQLVASSVMQALETRTPLVRCTTDGLSLAVGADGRILAGLPLRPAPTESARVLRISVPLGPGALPPLAWLAGAVALAANALLALGILHGLLVWARLLAVRAKSTPAAGATSPTFTGSGGS